MSRFSRLIPRFLRGDKSKSSVSRDSGSLERAKDGPLFRILCLDDTDLHLSFKGSSKASNLLDRVFAHLNLVEKDYFGLRFVDQSDQTHWLDPQKPLSSQLKSCSQPYTFYFGVKFYPPDPCKLKEEITRYQFFLQIKRDILQGRLPITFDEAAELFAFAVQAELRDYDPRYCSEGYVSEFRFVPNQTQELEEQIARFHQHLGGMSPGQAEYKFLDKVKWLDMYGVDLHSVLGEGNTEYFLGLTPTGIVVYKNKSKVGNYFWPRITKVTFKGKIFIIKVRDKNNDEHTYAFEVATKTRTKHLWKCCVEHHTFFRINQLADTLAISSKHSRHGSRRSGRNDRQNNNDIRQQPMVTRIPSRRQPTRSKSDSKLNGGKAGSYYSVINDAAVTRVVAPEPVQGSRHRSLPDLQRNQSPRSTRSAPWERDADTGLYTSGRESPVSLHSDVQKFPRRVGQTSDTESGHRRKYFPKNKGSDNESDVSFSRRRRRDGDSGSESDVSPMRGRRPKSSVEPWYENQWNETMQGMFPAHSESYMNGSVPSIHSAPAGEVKRRRRRRTKSPGTAKRPPEELKQHIVYDLVDTEGMAPEDLQDIPYMKVETKAEPFKIKYSPHVNIRQRYRSPKRKGFGDQDPSQSQLPQNGEPPPPYTPSESARRTPELGHRNYMSDTNAYNNRSDLETQSNKSGSTYRSARYRPEQIFYYGDAVSITSFDTSRSWDTSRSYNTFYQNQINSNKESIPEQSFGHRMDNIRSRPPSSAGSAIQYRVQSTKQENTSTNQSDDTLGPNSESVSDDTLEAIDYGTESNVATETEVKDRQPRPGSSEQRYRGTGGYTSDVTPSHPRTSGYMSDVVSSRSQNYRSNTPNNYRPASNSKDNNSPFTDVSKVSQRYRSPVNGAQVQNVNSLQQENSPYNRTVNNSRQENSPYSRRHHNENFSPQNNVSDVESSRRHRTPESSRKYEPPSSNINHRPPPAPYSGYSVTPPSTAEILRTDNAHIHEQSRSYLGQQHSAAVPSTPDRGRRVGYSASSGDNVNSSITSSNLSSIAYNSSPYKQTTPSSVQTDNTSQPSSVFTGNSPKSYNAHVSARLFSPQQMADFSRHSAQENASYNSSGYAPNRSNIEQNNSMYNKSQFSGTPPQSNTSFNHRQSQARGVQERSPYYDQRGPSSRQHQENFQYGDRSQTQSRNGPDPSQYQGRTPDKANQSYSSYNGHAGVPSRTDYSNANSSLNTSQFHSSRLGYQQSPSYSSPGKTHHPHHLQASTRSGFSIPSQRGLNHSAVDASALRPVYRGSHRHDLVTEI